MFRIALILAVLAAFAAPGAAQVRMPQQDHGRSAPQADTVRHEKSGTAFFVNDLGALLTTRHMVEDCVGVIVSKEGSSLPARVVAVSDRFDLGLIKVPRTLGIAAVFPRDVTTVANDMVFASSYDKLAEMTQRGGTIANATVSSSQEAGYLAIESDVTFGSSGAPVLDGRGVVEGVISRRTTITRVLAVGAAEAKAFLMRNGVRFNEDDSPQLAGGASRANRAASISTRVTCLQN